MQTFATTTIRPNALHDQLLAAAGIPALVKAALRVESIGSAVTIYAPDDADPAPIQAVIAAHDPNTPGVAEAAASERTAATDDVRARTVAALTRLAQIQTQMASVADALDPNAATPATLAQVRGALRLVALAVGDEARDLRAAMRLLGAQA